MIARSRPGRAGRDRWVVSYADMVTLLFACFAALYASSTAIQRLESTKAQTTNAPADQTTGGGDLSELTGALTRVAEGTAVAVRQDTRGVVVSLPEAGAFSIGQADLSDAARRVISDLATVLAAEHGDIRVEGHTDDVPIATSRFASNWDLSAARATEVIRFLIAHGAIAPSRLSAAGYGEFRPLVLNDSRESRARNRRVDIVVIR